VGCPGCDLFDIDLLTAPWILVVVYTYERAVGTRLQLDNGALRTVSTATLTRNTLAKTDNDE